MRKKLTILALLVCQFAFARKIYIAASGSDANDGLTPGTAWKTITKLNTNFSTLNGGDTGFFRRGDEFYGTIVPSKNGLQNMPIVITAYGTGAKPVITGFTTISGWTSEGGGIYSKVITSAAQTNMAIIDGVQYAMGRYPDAGYLSYQTSTTNTITDNAIGSATNWTGAEAIIRKEDWILDRCPITTHSGKTLTFTNKGTSATPRPGNGYFIQNDLRTLNQYGEWYHDAAGTGKFYMYFGSVDPNTKVVKVATINYLFSDVSGRSYITVSDLNFQGSIDNIINVTFASNFVTIQNSIIQFAGQTGVQFIDANKGDSILNNTISCSNRSGICSNSNATVIMNNVITNSGLFPGTAYLNATQLTGDGGYNGIFCGSDQVVIKYNTIRMTGSNGITLKYKSSAVIQYNRIDSISTLFNDGGGIYTPGANVAVRLIDHNIISNIIGNSQGSSSTNPCAGIYLDESASNVQVTNNTIFNNRNGFGIKVHISPFNTIWDNTAFNIGFGINLADDNTGGQITNLSILRNIFVAKTLTQQALWYYSATTALTPFGTANNNYYLRPIKDDSIFTIRLRNAGTKLYPIATWRTISGQDAGSIGSPKSITDTNDLRFEYNASDTDKVILFTGLSYINAKGDTINNSITVPAWGSHILIANGVAPTSNIPPGANAGPDQTITLPANSVTLTGIGNDTDGTIYAYFWALISGPDGSSFSAAASATTTLNNLIQGLYQVELIVTDNKGATAKKRVWITVNAAPVAPRKGILLRGIKVRP